MKKLYDFNDYKIEVRLRWAPFAKSHGHAERIE